MQDKRKRKKKFDNTYITKKEKERKERKGTHIKREERKNVNM